MVIADPPLEEVIALLAECNLPDADIDASSPIRFFGVRDGSVLVAVVGLELYPPVGLLRSLAVAPDFRARGTGRKLVAFSESFAAANGVQTLFLMTTTAERFFLALGYAQASRASAPAAIRGTSQFSTLCPDSSAFLSKHVGCASVPVPWR